ncbi:MAG: hypothetical protein Q8M31_01770 [Beijerinckiaceae bacterium]|nr:hypothetical protein [Beijerinckiaceae bacterium]
MQPTKLILFCLGAFAILLASGVEFGSRWLLKDPSASFKRPGVGITAVAYFDLVFLYTLALISLDLFRVAPAVIARFQGLITLIGSFLGCLGSLALAFLTFMFLMMMVSLLLTVPFGTVAYIAVWGDFDVEGAKAILALTMTLKLIGVGLMLFASPSFLKNKGFMALAIFSLGFSFVLGLLHTWPPGILVSIADALGALVITIVLVVWTIALILGSLPAIWKALRSLTPG